MNWIDSMTRKINMYHNLINFYQSNFSTFLEENSENFQIGRDLILYFRSNNKFRRRLNCFTLELKYPHIDTIYQQFLKSEKFKRLINQIKTKNDEEYLKLFFKHSKNFMKIFFPYR